MNLGELLMQGRMKLKKANVEDPSSEAGLLLSWLLNKELSFVIAHPEKELEPEWAKRYEDLVERRCRKEPFHYITGTREFMSLAFEINPHVLIPRPDTELLAQAALYSLGIRPSFFSFKEMFRLPEKKAYRAADVGTGSGCLAVSLAYYCKNVNVTAVDISEDALFQARKNGEKWGVNNRIQWLHRDFLELKGKQEPLYDLIVSNPPYIPTEAVEGLMEDVKGYEPRLALDGGDDGLVFYRALSVKGKELLKTDGILIAECGYDQAQAVSRLFSKQGFRRTLILTDLAGIERVVAACDF